MNEFEIKCPECGAIVTADNLMKERIREEEKLYKKKFDAENKANLEKKDADYKKLQNILADTQKSNKENEDAIKKQALSDAKRESQEEMDKVKKNQQIVIDRLQSKVEAMQKQINQGSMELQGEVQEEVIEDLVTKKFPNDELNTTKKGANGADSTLTIKSKDKNSIGKIEIESKDTKDFQENWINKLLVDIKDKGADFGVIITKALPKNFPKDQGFQAHHGGSIFVCEHKYSTIHLLLIVLKLYIQRKKTNENKNTENIPVEYEKLWDFITGPVFVTSFILFRKNLIDVSTAADKMDTTVRKQVANQKKLVDDAITTHKQIILNLITSVGQESLPHQLCQFDEHQLSQFDDK